MVTLGHQPRGVKHKTDNQALKKGTKEVLLNCLFLNNGEWGYATPNCAQGTTWDTGDGVEVWGWVKPWVGVCAQGKCPKHGTISLAHNNLNF